MADKDGDKHKRSKSKPNSKKSAKVSRPKSISTRKKKLKVSPDKSVPMSQVNRSAISLKKATKKSPSLSKKVKKGLKKTQDKVDDMANLVDHKVKSVVQDPDKAMQSIGLGKRSPSKQAHHKLTSPSPVKSPSHKHKKQDKSPHDAHHKGKHHSEDFFEIQVTTTQALTEKRQCAALPIMRPIGRFAHGCDHCEHKEMHHKPKSESKREICMKRDNSPDKRLEKKKQPAAKSPPKG